MTTQYDEPKCGFTDDGRKVLFDADYGRMGVIRLTVTVCCGCGKAAPCLHVDQSEAEYKPGLVCRDCIAKLFGESK